MKTKTMKLAAYKEPANWFQVGWNMALENPGMCVLPSLSSWELYDYLAGFAAAMHKRNLPNHWLQ